MNPRLELLQAYPFERLRTLLAGVAPPTGLRHVALSIGEPKHAPPAFIGAALLQSLGESLGSYPLALGRPELREAIARWLERRFALAGGSVSPDDNVLPVNGTREALFSFVQAALDTESGARPLVLMPNPFYQIYEGAALLAGAVPHYLNCTADNDYLPDLDAVDARIWNRCQLLFLCTPGNPTGAVMPQTYLRRALELSSRYGFLIASDECYSELYFDESAPPAGLLQAAFHAGNTRFERCIVFHSLSKRSSVPGLRSGFVAGDAKPLARYRLYRTYHGCAVPLHTQLASLPAWLDEAHVIENRRLYREKFARATPLIAAALQQEIVIPAGGFYLWPTVADDEVFSRGLFERQHVTVLPGRYLGRETESGNPGVGRIRISLVASVADCDEAARRIAEFAKSSH